ncbi:MAG: DEAD/DEAH box helicase [Candidatus Bathyarchaeia archaeon]|nr:DEAD/DEAH box helicase [Candidatus Bathyarchaeota archaeon]
MVEPTVFDELSKPIRLALYEKGFKVPTEAQSSAVPKILKGLNVLLIAPTATGKTESAVLPVFERLIREGGARRGIRALYITPLRALNRDMLRRLEWWAGKAGLSVALRHGDTESRLRSLQARNPPAMLITTPETLQAILPGRVMRRHLSGVGYVIIDEVHELAEDKRGSQLALALERLRLLTGREFQVVGLSATIGSPGVVARFLVGSERNAEVVQVPIGRSLRVSILFPTAEPADLELAARLYVRPEVAARMRVLRDLIEGHRTVLLFTNTRAVAEVLASRFKVWDVNFPVSIHHGSLTKPVRVTAEKGLREGALKGVVCTSSLELGIDVGAIDYVIQYMSPRQVTRFLQRIGRSSHRVGGVAEGAIVVMDCDDALEAMAIARRALAEELEEVDMPEKPLDVLTHQIVGLLFHQRRWGLAEMLHLIRRAYPFRDLSLEEFKRVLLYMHERYPRLAWVSLDEEVIARPRRVKPLYEYYYERLSMIPDEKHYLVVDDESDMPLGLLDEAFVAEYGEPGTKFILKGSPWRMLRIRGDKIHVKPIEDPTGAVPSWVGEEVPVPLEVALEVGEIRRLASEMFLSGYSEKLIGETLASKYPVDAETAVKALEETFEQLEGGFPAPSDKLVMIEEWDDYLIIHCHFGTLVNRSLGRLLGHLISDEVGFSVGVQQDPYRIVLNTLGAFDGERVIALLRGSAGKDVKGLLVEACSRSGLFLRRLIHVARRFGAISKWADLSDVNLRRLAKSLEGTVVYDEALNEAFRKDLDLNNTIRVLDMMARGELELVRVKGLTPLGRISLERVGERADLVPPETMDKLILESAKARLLNEVLTFVCTSCWGWGEMVRIKDLDADKGCPACGSRRIGMTKASLEEASRLLEGGRAYAKRDKILKAELSSSARLYEEYGSLAALAYAGRGLDIQDAEDILKGMGVHEARSLGEDRLIDRLVKEVIEAEKEALRRRF